jgi:hypothetical protein
MNEQRLLILILLSPILFLSLSLQFYSLHVINTRTFVYYLVFLTEDLYITVGGCYANANFLFFSDVCC